jgi:hypothetical protein
MQDAAVLIECLGGPDVPVAELKLAIDIIFDEGYAMLAQQGDLRSSEGAI